MALRMLFFIIKGFPQVFYFGNKKLLTFCGFGDIKIPPDSNTVCISCFCIWPWISGFDDQQKNLWDICPSRPQNQACSRLWDALCAFSGMKGPLLPYAILQPAWHNSVSLSFFHLFSSDDSRFVEHLFSWFSERYYNQFHSNCILPTISIAAYQWPKPGEKSCLLKFFMQMPINMDVLRWLYSIENTQNLRQHLVTADIIINYRFWYPFHLFWLTVLL